MSVYKFKCSGCGSTQCEKDDNGYRCIYCGNIQDVIFASEEKPEQTTTTQEDYVEPEVHTNQMSGRTRSLLIRLILCVLCGTFGVHKFMEGKILSGIIYLFSGGLFGIGIFVDVINYIIKLSGSRRSNGDML